MIKEYFTKRGQALQMGCLLHICCQMQAMCCRFSGSKGYFWLKVVYVQADTTDVQLSEAFHVSGAYGQNDILKISLPLGHDNVL